jgi:hypothetical protein
VLWRVWEDEDEGDVVARPDVPLVEPHPQAGRAQSRPARAASAAVPQSLDLLLLHPAAEQTGKGALLPWLKRLDYGLRKVGLRQGWIGSTK